MKSYVKKFVNEWERIQKLHKVEPEAAVNAMHELREVYDDDFLFLSEYAETLQYGNKALNLGSGTNFLRPEETLDSIEKYELGTFTVSCQTTALLEFIAECMKRGWYIVGKTEVYTMNPEYQRNPYTALVFEKVPDLPFV